MFKDSLALIQTRYGCTDYLRIGVVIHEGATLSPLLFIIILDVLALELRSKLQKSMLFADDLVICETSRDKVEKELESWRGQFD